ncbi:MAG: DUF4244 domain-containing protein [Lawsonella sp.]
MFTFWKELWQDETGMSTVECAVGTIGAAAFGALLLAIAKSDTIREALMGIIQQALNSGL